MKSKQKPPVLQEYSSGLSITQLQRILETHSLPSFIMNNHIYGVVPYLQVDTLQQGFEITDITYYNYKQIRDYLGY